MRELKEIEASIMIAIGVLSREEATKEVSILLREHAMKSHSEGHIQGFKYAADTALMLIGAKND